MAAMPDRAAATIRDFGEQWTHFTGNEGFHGSLELFADILGPLLSVEEFRGARVADIGSGTGRIVRMLAAAGAGHILAVEPSAAYDVLARNVADLGDRVTLLRATGAELPPSGDLDFVVSFGVLHHIPDPEPVLRAARAALRPGGRLAIWLYGREGNELYLALADPLRRLTVRLSHPTLLALSRALAHPLAAYVWACRRAPAALPLPMRRYMADHLGRLTRAKLVETIYDQLNPHEARYYTRAEAEELVRGAGFVGVRSHHRLGYSWTVVGERSRE
jgi:SAM-dependent methyltransferase